MDNSGAADLVGAEDLDLDDWDEEEGPSDEPVSDVDLAADALQTARFMTSGATGGVDGGSRRRRVGTGRPRRSPLRSIGAIYAGARPDERDPMPIGRVVQQAADSLGWSEPMARARIFGQWEELVGPAIAARCEPVSLNSAELRVSAESTAWATQLRLMAPQILGRMCRELPPGTVTKIIFTGPTGPSWRRGPWSMHGGRGVRDTYG